MAKKSDFKTVNPDIEELDQKIQKHRRKIFMRVVRIVGAVLFVIIAVELWMALRTYSSYETRTITKQGDRSASSFMDFNGNVIQYSNDGIVCQSGNGELIWNQAFEMATPQVSFCENYLAVYDKSGTEIYIMTPSGQSTKLETSMPINTLCIAQQGTIAVLMKGDENYFVKLYDKTGKELANGEFYASQGKIPVDIALSYDAQKLAVAMIDITGGAVDSVVNFYNFGSVGQNEIDNNVGSFSYKDTLISEIQYVSKNKMIAICDAKAIIFEGTQKPEPSKEIEYGNEPISVFHSSKYVGISYANNDEGYHIKVFDLNGNTVMENDTQIPYGKVELLNNNEICVLGQYECELYTIHSIKKFSYKFDEPIYKVIHQSGYNGYIFLREGAMEEVRLK
ncbi:MAG: DUF5711 family protein [Agathobacter sp.]|nr:DUF5711 family protein [Agathobacter sp.]